MVDTVQPITAEELRAIIDSAGASLTEARALAETLNDAKRVKLAAILEQLAIWGLTK